MSTNAPNTIEPFIEAIHDFNVSQLSKLFDNAIKEHSFDQFAETIIIPIMDHLGNNWSIKPGIAYEHFFSYWLRAKLYPSLLHQPARPRKTIVCACCPESQHEIGLILFSLKLINKGFKVIYLGPNLPTQQAQLTAEKVNADAIVLSTFLTPSPETQQSIIALAAKYKRPVFLGGRGSIKISEKFPLAGGTLLPNELERSTQIVASLI